MICKSGGFTKMVCCDCGLVHLWVFEVIRGKMQADDIVKIIVSRDDKQTEEIRQKASQKEKPWRGVIEAVKATGKPHHIE